MKSDCSMISIIKHLVWLELIMISSIDLCGDTKLSKAFNKEAEQMVNKTSTHQICFNILNNYDIFGHKLLSIKKKNQPQNLNIFQISLLIHVELFILRRKAQSKKRLQPICSLLNVCPQQEDFENRIKFTFYIRFWEVSPYKCVSMGDLNCSVTVYFWLCCYGGM